MPYFRSLSKEYFCPAAPENLHTTTAEEQASKTAANCDEKKNCLKNNAENISGCTSYDSNASLASASHFNRHSDVAWN